MGDTAPTIAKVNVNYDIAMLLFAKRSIRLKKQYLGTNDKLVDIS